MVKSPLMLEITFRNAAPRDIAAIRSLIPLAVMQDTPGVLVLRGDAHQLSKGQRHFIAALAKQKKLTLRMEYAPERAA